VKTSPQNTCKHIIGEIKKFKYLTTVPLHNIYHSGNATSESLSTLIHVPLVLNSTAMYSILFLLLHTTEAYLMSIVGNSASMDK